MGYSDLGAYGAPNVSTPHVDSLAASGVKFTHWVSAASICTPSRAALQTGPRTAFASRSFPNASSQHAPLSWSRALCQLPLP